MTSSSASRRDMARSFELGRTGGEVPRMAAAAARHEGWMVRYGRRKIGRSFFHTRYFVLDNKLLAYYKKKPKDNMVPLKALLIDGNCRVEDRGLKTHHGQAVLSTGKQYNVEEKNILKVMLLLKWRHS